jgi:hypothetical protein
MGSIANGIAVIGGDIYVVGFDNMASATIWKNGVATALDPGASKSVANAIATNGTDVYVSGLADGLPVYWKNGIKTILPGQGTIGDQMGIAVNGTDVYIVGGFGSDKAAESIFWKNGLATKFDNGKLDVLYGVTVVQH